MHNSTPSPVLRFLFCSFPRDQGSPHGPNNIITTNSGFNTGGFYLHLHSVLVITIRYSNIWLEASCLAFNIRSDSAFRKALIQLHTSSG